MQISPRVSIIIVNLEQDALTVECIRSVVENTQEGVYEIILVDNGTTAVEAEKLLRTSSLGFRIGLSRNLFFGEANNIGVEHAKGEYVTFLNNDVKVTRGWLDHLLMVFDKELCVGAVGPKLLYPDGRLQEAGAYIREDGWAIQVGRIGRAPPRSYADGIQVADYCSAACLLMKKREFLALGGFDPIFDPAYFEDCDLAFRLRSIGLLTYYCGHVSVFHQGSVTSDRLWSVTELNIHLAANHNKFFERWGGYLRARLQGNCEPDPLSSIEWELEAPTNEKDAVVLYSSNPLNVSESSRRLLQVAFAFQDICDVIIAADEISSRCRVYSLCREFRIPLRSFRIRKMPDVDQSNSVVVTLSENGVVGYSLKGPLALESDVGALLQLIDEFGDGRTGASV